MAKIIGDWQWKVNEKKTAILASNRVLQRQYAGEFKDLGCLMGRANYGSQGAYTAAKRKAVRRPVSVYNYASYWHVSQLKPIMVVDEAHNLPEFLCELGGFHIKQSEHPFETTMETVGDIRVWLEQRIRYMKMRQMFKKMDYEDDIFRFSKIAKMLEGIDSLYVEHHGHADPSLFIKPIRVQKCKWWRAEKIILMSATISLQEVERMGLGNHQVLHHRCGTEIPVENRPFIFDPVGSMRWDDQEETLPRIAAKLRELAAKHPKEKGIIHLPYRIKDDLRPLIDDPRFLWYDKTNKSQIYERFRGDGEYPILVAPGMAEGIDLPGDLGRWQVIVKVQYPSLSDHYVRALKRLDPETYSWVTVRTIIQQAGRICRSPTDYGVTYCLDSAFASLYASSKKFWPEWFKSAVKW